MILLVRAVGQVMQMKDACSWPLAGALLVRSPSRAYSSHRLSRWFWLGSLSERQPPAPLVEQKCFSYKIRAKRDDKKIIVLEDVLYDTERDAGTGLGTEKYRTIFCRGKGHYRENTDPINEYRRGIFLFWRASPATFLTSTNYCFFAMNVFCRYRVKAFHRK